MVKLLEHEGDNSLVYTAKVKNEWRYTSVLPVCLHGMHRYNFAFNRNILVTF